MARIESDPNYTAPTFPRATAATDLFKKEDVQNLAAAISTHDHSTGKGVAIPFTSIPAGTITSGMIADATIVAADIADGAITSAKIADGTIATVDIANAAVTNAKLGPDTARANLLTNGGFEIWQRGNGPFTTGYTADRWFPGGTTSTWSVAKIASTIGSAGNSAQVIYTHGAAGFLEFQALCDSLAGISPQHLYGKAVTFAVQVKSSVSGTVKVRLQDGTSTIDSAYNVGTGEQTLVATITVAQGAPYLYCKLRFDVTACTAEINDARLVVGSQAADYAPLPPADDLARCLRYYEILGESANEIVFYGYNAAGQASSLYMSYKVRKAVAPTLTKNGTWNPGNCSQPSALGTGIGGFSMYTTATALGPFTLNNNAANANFTVEANP